MFESEGNRFLYESAMEETKRCDWGIGIRYFYHLNL